MNIYEQAGMLSFLAGMRRARHLLNQEIEAMEHKLQSALPQELQPGEDEKRTVEAPGPVVKNLSTQQALWTPERRAAASKRMKKLRAQGVVVPPNTKAFQEKETLKKELTRRAGWRDKAPRKIGDRYTIYGLMDELQTSDYKIRQQLEMLKISPKSEQHPMHSGTKVKTFSASLLPRLRRALSVKPVKGAAPRHPREKGHPGHDAWREQMRQARLASLARQAQQKINGAEVAAA